MCQPILIATSLIEFEASDTPWADPCDVFVCTADFEIRAQSGRDLPPLEVCFDQSRGKYVARATPENELLLFAARKVALVQYPCAVDGPHPPIGTPSESVAAPAVDFSAVFADLLPMTIGLAQSASRRSRPGVGRVADDQDWGQEALLALWREVHDRIAIRFVDGAAVKRFTAIVIRNQAARSAMDADGQRELPEEFGEEMATLDAVIAAEQYRSATRDERRLRHQVRDLLRMIRLKLETFPQPRALAAAAWLDGHSFTAAGKIAGVTTSKARGAIIALRRNLAVPIRRFRDSLQRAYRKWPPIACRVRLGTAIVRLLYGPLGRAR